MSKKVAFPNRFQEVGIQTLLDKSGHFRLPKFQVTIWPNDRLLLSYLKFACYLEILQV